MQVKFTELIKQLLSFTVVIIIIIGVYYYSYLSGGELTTAKSCSSSYIAGDYDINYLKKECPNLSKESILKNIESQYDNGNISETEYLKLLVDVNNNF